MILSKEGFECILLQSLKGQIQRWCSGTDPPPFQSVTLQDQQPGTFLKSPNRHNLSAPVWGEEKLETGGPDYFSSKNLALQAQKKILSKMATKTMANMLIDDTSSEIFDELYKVTKEHTRNKKEAHKIMKDLIKVAIKIGILYRNNQFNQEELEIVDKFRKKLNQTAMTIVSFYEVEYTFDRNVLAELLNECKDLVHELVDRHLTPRSHGRINHVFNHFADVEFLTALYSLDGDCRPYLKKICDGINKLLDEKVKT
ncbi:tumor necrosis factor alpha-induced protein 8-like protein 3 [Alligator mississippiensis]|uniref:Tumor necrosis factor alpha-induced protein 8-like protein 3 n=1 Tax=Alligator mississippiensis TaxID=8496 RepID=A0A151M9L1_ALLMI|nr:tumor necrosis factor alpha-induced protein 8-like protein 3 [Alligator mississippiensis]